jgi:hypothetical protein
MIQRCMRQLTAHGSSDTAHREGHGGLVGWPSVEGEGGNRNAGSLFGVLSLYGNICSAENLGNEGGPFQFSKKQSVRIPHPAHLLRFRHSHGGTGCGSAHKPILASRAFFSNPSSTVSPGAYFRYHHPDSLLGDLPLSPITIVLNGFH